MEQEKPHTAKRLDELIAEADVYEKYKHLFAANELREARQRGEIEFYSLRKGIFYTEPQLVEYLEKRLKRSWQNAPLRAVRESDKLPDSSSSATNGSDERPDLRIFSDTGMTASDTLVARALEPPTLSKPRKR